MQAMKEGLGTSAIKRIATSFTAVLPQFDKESFVAECEEGLDDLELKQRVDHIIKVLHNYLPKNFSSAAKLLSGLKEHWIEGDTDDPLQTFAAWPVTDYVAVYGIDQPDTALPVLEKLTSLFSAEFAIRPFIKKYPELCQQYFKLWVVNDCDGVRRLVSEGTRPRLPWGMRLHSYIEKPETNLYLLTQLKNDDSLYVRRSVANHLNDIAKDHPELVLDVCDAWFKNASEETTWLIKHATRTIVKTGNPRVFPLLGYTDKPRVTLAKLHLSKKEIMLGESLDFELMLTSDSTSTQKIVLDYAIAFVKANGKQQNKVFKLKNIELRAGQCLQLAKSHRIKEITTRKYYSGEQQLIILINGEQVACQSFHLSI